MNLLKLLCTMRRHRSKVEKKPAWCIQMCSSYPSKDSYHLKNIEIACSISLTQLILDEDGHLYVFTGDGEPGGDLDDNAQNL